MKNEAIKNAFQLVESCDKTDLSSLLKFVERFIKVCSKELKRKVKTNGKRSSFFDTLEELNKKMNEEKSKRIADMLSTHTPRKIF